LFRRISRSVLKIALFDPLVFMLQQRHEAK